ncbi:MAG: Type 1 glutamine amidotransferase-like domain-containing protein [Peptococcaceae bacterium]|nr:Type 1 glutamine amidotransferase-like domain-containing protein [Peptococcaceae bacterium]
MKNLLLVSMLAQSIDLVQSALPNLQGKMVTYIPTAANVEDAEGIVEAESQLLEKLGLKVQVLDVAQETPAVIAQCLRTNDVIYIGGGNTFYLLQELRRSGADLILREVIGAGKLYIGESAGAAIVCPDIGYCAEIDDSTLAPALNGDFTALGIVTFTIVPHIDNPFMGAGAQNILEKYSSSLLLQAITDEQAIRVQGDAVTVL